MKNFVLKAIRFYQNYFSRGVLTYLIGESKCRFNPTCSAYAYQAVGKYGTIRGLFLGFKRIVRCHPWSKGGEDPLQ